MQHPVSIRLAEFIVEIMYLLCIPEATAVSVALMERAIKTKTRTCLTIPLGVSESVLQPAGRTLPFLWRVA